MSGTETLTGAAARTEAAPAPPVPVLAFGVRVVAVRQLTPSFRRVTFTGPGLRQFGVDGPVQDLRIKVMIPSRDEAGQCIELPSFAAPVTPGGAREADGAAVELGGGWYQAWLAMDPLRRGAMRTYTVRAFRPAGSGNAELDVDFVLHFDADGRGGPASTWAAGAEPGDAVTIIGPNAAAANCPTARGYGGIEWRPGLASHVLLAGDETAVPAVASILGSLPAGMTGSAILEVPGPADFQQLDSAADIRITWLARGGRPHGEPLAAAVRAAVAVPGAGVLQDAGEDPEDVDVDEVLLWETTAESTRPFYAWIAGEAAAVKDLRRYLVRDVGMDRRQVAFMGYWRQGKAEL